MENILFIPIALAIAVVFTDLPRRQPDTLVPIQLITFSGAAASVLLVIANSVAAVYWWTLLPRGPAAAFAMLDFLTSALVAVTAGGILLQRMIRPRREPDAAVSAWIQPEITALKPVVCGAHGIREVRLVCGSARGFEIEVVKSDAGADIRVGGGLPEKLARFRRHRAGGERRVRALIRFMLLHELGHVLNRDHRAYQFARAMQLAQLWYLVPVLAFQPWLATLLLRRDNEDAAVVGSLGLLVSATALLAAFQRATAAHFAVARERLADWRAVLTLTSADRDELLNATPGRAPFLEMALSALQPTGATMPLAALLMITWPGTERVGVRVQNLRTGQSAGRHEPLRWSGLAGVNTGALSVGMISLLGGAVSLWLPHGIVATLVLTFAALIATWPSTMLVSRADPTDPFGHGSASVERRIVTGAGYFLAHILALCGGYLVLLLHASLSPLRFVTAGDIVFVVAIVAGGSAFVAGMIVNLGPAQLRTRGELFMNVVPLLLGLAVIVPLSYILARGIGSDVEYPFGLLLMPVFTMFVWATYGTGSRFPLIRRLMPLGVLDPVGDFVRCRVWVVDVSADMNDLRRRHLFFRLTAIWASQFASAFAFAAVWVVAIRRDPPTQRLEVVFLYSFLGLLGLLPVAANRKRTVVNAIDSHRVTLLAMFDAPRTGALGSLLARLAPAIATELRGVVLRDGEKKTVADLRRAAELLELANAVGAADVVAAWRTDAVTILYEHAAEGVVRSWPGGPVSPHWTAWAARLALVTNMPAVPLARAAAKLLPPVLDSPRPIAIAASLARIAFVTGADIALPPVPPRRLLRATDSLGDLAAIQTHRGSDTETLRRTVRAQIWQALHSNSRRNFLILLDLLTAGSKLGEEHSALWSAADARLRDLFLEDDEKLLRRFH